MNRVCFLLLPAVVAFGHGPSEGAFAQGTPRPYGDNSRCYKFARAGVLAVPDGNHGDNTKRFAIRNELGGCNG